MTQTDIGGFTIWGTDTLSLPVLLSVPHAGRDYPQDIFDALRLAPAALLRLEDRYADLLARRSVRLGHPVIMAHRARAWIDLNRDEHDIDTEMVQGALRADYPAPGAKQRGGSALFRGDFRATVICGNANSPSRRSSTASGHFTGLIMMRFHKFLNGCGSILASLSFWTCTACHRSAPPPPRHPPQFVVGDRFGKSAASQYAELLLARLRAHGFNAALNHPYAGEYILRRHAKPRSNIHAIQFEVDRSLYLDSELRQPGAGL